MIKTTIRLLLFSSLFVFASCANQLAEDRISRENPTGYLKVGELGDPATFVFEGLESFTPDQVVDALRDHLGFLHASLPDAPLSDLLPIVRQSVENGYRAGGFLKADVGVSVDASSRRINVRVTEGLRYRSGTIKVVGAENIPVRELVRWLTEFSPPTASVLQTYKFDNSSAVLSSLIHLISARKREARDSGNEQKFELAAWEKGKPVRSDKASIEKISRTVDLAFRQFGYFSTRANVNVVPGEKQGIANLVIKISHEGKQATIDRIEVIGNNRNSRNEVLNYLRLKPDLAFSRDLILKTEQRLWKSARFLKYRVTYKLSDHADSENDKIELNIDLAELESAQKLSTEFTQIEKVMLKLHEWVSNLPYPSEDFMFSVTKQGEAVRSEVAKFILSERGMLIAIKEANQSEDGHLRYAGIVSPDSVVLYSPTQRGTVYGIEKPRRLQSQVMVLPALARHAKGPIQLEFNIGLVADLAEPKEAARSLGSRIRIPPVLFMPASKSTNHTYSIVDGVLTISNSVERVLVDARSGKLIEYTSFMPGTGLEVKIHSEKDAFIRASREMEAVTSDRRNFMDDQSPTSSLIGFLIHEVAKNELLTSKFREFTGSDKPFPSDRILRNEFIIPILASLEKLIAEVVGEKRNDRFHVPTDWVGKSAEKWGKEAADTAFVAFAYADEIFPAGAWPAVVARVAALLFFGERKLALAELHRADQAGDIGPLGYLTIASLMKIGRHAATEYGQPDWSFEHTTISEFAHKGLGRLSETNFRDDLRQLYERLLSDKQSLEGVVAVLRGLSEDNIEALSEWAAADARDRTYQTISALVHLLPEGKVKSVGEILDPIVGAYWEDVVQKWMHVRLSKLSASDKSKTVSSAVRPPSKSAMPPERQQVPLVQRPAPKLAKPPAKPKNSSWKVTEIRVNGTRRIDADTVRAYLSFRPGDTVDAAKLDKSLKAIYSTGLFSDVTLRREGGAVVVWAVEHPTINRIAFEGNQRFSDQTIDENIRLRPRVVYTRTRTNGDVKRIIDLYQRSGYFDVRVEPKTISLASNRIDLVFEIDEGPFIGVRSIIFIGNKRFSDSVLKNIVATKELGSDRISKSEATYIPDRVAFDRELLRRHYLANGFADFTVVSSAAEISRDRQGFDIIFTVQEGARYKFGKVDVTTNLENLTPDRLHPQVTIAKGDRYDANAMEKSVNNLVVAVGRLGHAFVDVRPRVRRDRKNRLIHVTFNVREAPRIFVERINITGNVRTVDEVIRREILLIEGDPFNITKLRRSRRRILDLGYFEKVKIGNVPGSTPDKTVVNVEVTEKSTGELSFGLGYSSIVGFVGDIALRDTNISGLGHNFELSLKQRGRRHRLDLKFAAPSFLALKSTLAGSHSPRPSATRGDCEATVRINGVWPSSKAVSSVKLGVHDRDDVVQRLGSASTIANFGQTKWYYIGRRTTTFGSCRPEVSQRNVTTISFDDAGLVDGIDSQTTGADAILKPVRRVTPMMTKENTPTPNPPHWRLRPIPSSQQ